MARHISCVGILFVAALAGCDQATLMRKITPREDEAAARRYVDLLRQNRFEQIEQDMDPGLKGPGLRDTLVTMATLFPAQEPTSTKVVGVKTFFNSDSRTTIITLEYEFPGKWLLVDVAAQKRAGVAGIVRFYVTPIADSLENMNRFTLVGKSASQYTILTLAILAPLFSLYAFVMCIKTKIKKTKWLWLILTLLGVGKLSVNWTSGHTFFMPIAVQLPPGGAAAPLYGAWLVYVSMPLGAIIFLIRRKGFVGSVQQDGQGGPVAQEGSNEAGGLLDGPPRL